MKKLKITVFTLLTAALISCGGGIDKQAANAEGFAFIETEMKAK